MEIMRDGALSGKIRPREEMSGRNVPHCGLVTVRPYSDCVEGGGQQHPSVCSLNTNAVLLGGPSH